MDIHAFKRAGNRVVALGVVTVPTAGGFASGLAEFPVQFGQGGLSIQQATCDILFLQLGPIDLDLLGLVVEVSQITIEITAEQGPGNLLGNLLCAIAGLLDPGGPGLGAIIDNLIALLNQLIDVLNQLNL